MYTTNILNTKGETSNKFPMFSTDAKDEQTVRKHHDWCSKLYRKMQNFYPGRHIIHTRKQRNESK